MTPVGLLLITSCKLYYFVKKVAAQLEINFVIPDKWRGIFAAFSLIKQRRAEKHTLILHKRSSKLAVFSTALLIIIFVKRFLWTASFVSLFYWLKSRKSNSCLKPKFLIQTADCKQLRYHLHAKWELTDELTDWRTDALTHWSTEWLIYWEPKLPFFNDKICVRKKILRENYIGLQYSMCASTLTGRHKLP